MMLQFQGRASLNPPAGLNWGESDWCPLLALSGHSVRWAGCPLL